MNFKKIIKFLLMSFVFILAFCFKINATETISMGKGRPNFQYEIQRNVVVNVKKGIFKDTTKTGNKLLIHSGFGDYAYEEDVKKSQDRLLAASHEVRQKLINEKIKIDEIEFELHVSSKLIYIINKDKEQIIFECWDSQLFGDDGACSMFEENTAISALIMFGLAEYAKDGICYGQPDNNIFAFKKTKHGIDISSFYKKIISLGKEVSVHNSTNVSKDEETLPIKKFDFSYYVSKSDEELEEDANLAKLRLEKDANLRKLREEIKELVDLLKWCEKVDEGKIKMEELGEIIAYHIFSGKYFNDIFEHAKTVLTTEEYRELLKEQPRFFKWFSELNYIIKCYGTDEKINRATFEELTKANKLITDAMENLRIQDEQRKKLFDRVTESFNKIVLKM